MANNLVPKLFYSLKYSSLEFSSSESSSKYSLSESSLSESSDEISMSIVIYLGIFLFFGNVFAFS